MRSISFCMRVYALHMDLCKHFKLTANFHLDGNEFCGYTYTYIHRVRTFWTSETIILVNQSDGQTHTYIKRLPLKWCERSSKTTIFGMCECALFTFNVHVVDHLSWSIHLSKNMGWRMCTLYTLYSVVPNFVVVLYTLIYIYIFDFSLFEMCVLCCAVCQKVTKLKFR